MAARIKHQLFFQHSPEAVWEYLTNAELMELWLMKNDFQPVIGHKFQFQAKPIPKMGFDGNIFCEVLEIIPNKKLVYTWKGGPKPGVIGLDTTLTWSLSPEGEGTRLVLEHTGFKGWKNYLASIFMEQGWKKGIARRFANVLNEME